MKFLYDAIDATFKKQHEVDETNLTILKDIYESWVQILIILILKLNVKI